MPSAMLLSGERITKFTNCRLLRGHKLVNEDLWVSSSSGQILRSQEVFYDQQKTPDEIIDLGGRIISPGLIDIQLNGAFGFNFSIVPENINSYNKSFRQVNKLLVQTGVTSYLPTVTSQRAEVYHSVLPYLGPSGALRIADDGAESLGAHCEGPFLSPTKNGVHAIEVLLSASSFSDLEECYGALHLKPKAGHNGVKTSIKMITAAPEMGSMNLIIPELTSRGILFSIGHSEATYEDASSAIKAGATMITHLFNAMRPLHHRNPGIFGVLGTAESLPRPYFGIIADGVHLHPTTIKIAFNAHPEGFILVTDAMHLVGLEDGTYEWTNGDRLVKSGLSVTKEGSDTIAGSSITLIECMNNFLNWSEASIPQALNAVTTTPAKMLGLSGVKGTLDAGADADIVVLNEEQSEDGKRKNLIVDQVWKFGTKVFDRSQT